MSDDAEIRSVVATYVEGMARGDAGMLRRAFHPGASIIGHFGGGLEWSDLDTFITACVDEAIPADAPVPPFAIEALDVDGDAARVWVVNVWAGLDVRDWLSLLKHDGRWQIVAKLFRHLA